MAQKSTREGLKKEYVDYLGNLIIEGKLKEDILKLGNDNYPTLNKFNNLVESLNNEIEARTASDDMLSEDITENRDKISVLQTKTRINYLRPTIPTTTVNGVTITNNGDGTFTLNGTSTAYTSFYSYVPKLNKGTYKLVGTPKAGGSELNMYIYDSINNITVVDTSNGAIFNALKDGNWAFTIQIGEGVTCDNIVFKPMITDDLSATYDNFISFDDSLVNVNILNNNYYTKTVNFSVSVSANESVITYVNYDLFDVDVTKILAWQLSWSNSSNDNPLLIIEYQELKNYLARIIHKWSVAQDVNFNLSLLLRR